MRLAVSLSVAAVVAALALLPVSFVPAMVSPDAYGSAYVVIAFLLGVLQLAFAARFCQRLDDLSARRLLRATLVYLPLLMAALLVAPLFN